MRTLLSGGSEKNGEDETVAEEPKRYCTKCGQELSLQDQFCGNCGTPVHRAARVPTPEAATTGPQPPPVQQVRGTEGSAVGRVRAAPYWITFVCLAVLALLIGDNGTLVGLASISVAAVWVYRDGKSRGMEPLGWAVGVFFLFIVF